MIKGSLKFSLTSDDALDDNRIEMNNVDDLFANNDTSDSYGYYAFHFNIIVDIIIIIIYKGQYSDQLLLLSDNFYDPVEKVLKR